MIYIYINNNKFLYRNFPKNHKFRKLFNPNTLKLSYRSMANLHSLTKQLLTDEKKPIRLCNCRYKDSCSLGWQLFS